MAPLSASQLPAEELCAGEYVEYYSPLHVSGDRRRHRISRVLGVNIGADTPLRLNSRENVPVTWLVKRYAGATGLIYSEGTTKWRKIRTYKLRSHSK